MVGVARLRTSRCTLLVVLFGLTLAACSGSGFEYVENRDKQIFFKVPEDWKVFSTKEIAESAGLTVPPLMQDQFAWTVQFDGAPQPSVDNLFSVASPYPQGIARVIPIEAASRDTFSLQSLRNALVPIDETARQDPEAVRIIGSQDIVQADGFRGQRVDYILSDERGSLTVTQIGMVDPATQSMYLFAVLCESACYESHRSMIDQVIDSYTVRKPQL